MALRADLEKITEMDMTGSTKGVRALENKNKLYYILHFSLGSARCKTQASLVQTPEIYFAHFIKKKTKHGDFMHWLTEIKGK